MTGAKRETPVPGEAVVQIGLVDYLSRIEGKLDRMSSQVADLRITAEALTHSAKEAEVAAANLEALTIRVTALEARNLADQAVDTMRHEQREQGKKLYLVWVGIVINAGLLIAQLVWNIVAQTTIKATAVLVTGTPTP